MTGYMSNLLSDKQEVVARLFACSGEECSQELLHNNNNEQHSNKNDDGENNTNIQLDVMLKFAYFGEV